MIFNFPNPDNPVDKLNVGDLVGLKNDGSICKMGESDSGSIGYVTGITDEGLQVSMVASNPVVGTTDIKGEIIDAILENRSILPLLIGIHPELDDHIDKVLKA